MDPIPKHMLCPHCKSVLDNPCLQGEADGQATMTAFCSVCQRTVELILSAKAAHVFGLTPGNHDHDPRERIWTLERTIGATR